MESPITPKRSVETILLNNVKYVSNTFGVKEGPDDQLNVFDIDYPLLKLYIKDSNKERRDKLYSHIIDIMMLYEEKYIETDTIREQNFELSKRERSNIKDKKENIKKRKRVK